MIAQVVHGSSAQMAVVSDKSVPLILTSPPYYPFDVDDRLKAGNFTKNEIPSLEEQIVSHAYGLRAVFKEMARVLSENGTLIIQTRDVRLAKRLVGIEGIHRSLIENLDFHLVSRHFWLPKFITHARRQVQRQLALAGTRTPHDPEVFLVFKRNNSADEDTDNFYDGANILNEQLMRSSKCQQATPHPHQAPEVVLNAFIENYTKSGDLIVDPFTGGGTTLLCAQKLGRSAIGYEIDPYWANIAEQQVNQLDREKSYGY